MSEEEEEEINRTVKKKKIIPFVNNGVLCSDKWFRFVGRLAPVWLLVSLSLYYLPLFSVSRVWLRLGCRGGASFCRPIVSAVCLFSYCEHSSAYSFISLPLSHSCPRLRLSTDPLCIIFRISTYSLINAPFLFARATFIAEVAFKVFTSTKQIARNLSLLFKHLVAFVLSSFSSPSTTDVSFFR